MENWEKQDFAQSPDSEVGQSKSNNDNEYFEQQQKQTTTFNAEYQVSVVDPEKVHPEGKTPHIIYTIKTNVKV
jgi:hypothetical protein